jgi:hypothetical protein
MLIGTKLNMLSVTAERTKALHKRLQRESDTHNITFIHPDILWKPAGSQVPIKLHDLAKSSLLLILKLVNKCENNIRISHEKTGYVDVD